MSLERIEITPFAVIAGDVLQHRRTGSLTIVQPPLRKVLYFSQGELVMSASEAPADSLGHFLVQRGVMPAERATEIFGGEENNAVAALHESGLLDLSTRQTMLREWLASQFIQLFSLDEGTAAFEEDEPLPPEKRVFVQSTAALLVDGIRSITNGLVLRRSLGDLKREIELARDSRFRIEALPLTDVEREIATSLQQRSTIESFLKQFAHQSAIAGKVLLAMLSLGVYKPVEHRAAAAITDFDDMQRDLELLAAIGSSDQRSLRAIAFSKQLATLDHYQVLDVPRAATRAQVLAAGELQKKRYDPLTFPAAMSNVITQIVRRLDEAVETLREPARRAAYDKLLHNRGASDASIHQRLTQRMIAEQNYAKAKELTGQNDFYGAILLLKQTVHFLPDHSDAWVLLGACQERNPKWRRDAAESFQMALSVDPNNVDALISLGDLYKAEGLISRAQTCYDDVLKIAPENQQARSRLAGLKKR